MSLTCSTVPVTLSRSYSLFLLHCSGKFADAVSEYTQAIRLDPSGHVYYSNRAMTYLKARSTPQTFAVYR